MEEGPPDPASSLPTPGVQLMHLPTLSLMTVSGVRR